MNKLRSSDENLGAPYTDRGGNLLEWLYQLRDRQREQQGKGAWLIKGRDLPWENNRQGKMKWFLHPALDNTCDSLDDHIRAGNPGRGPQRRAEITGWVGVVYLGGQRLHAARRRTS